MRGGNPVHFVPGHSGGVVGLVTATIMGQNIHSLVLQVYLIWPFPTAEGFQIRSVFICVIFSLNLLIDKSLSSSRSYVAQIMHSINSSNSNAKSIRLVSDGQL